MTVQDEQVVEMCGFDGRGVLVGRAAVDWATGNWAVRAGGAVTCNVWDRAEAEAILRRAGAVLIREGDGRR